MRSSVKLFSVYYKLFLKELMLKINYYTKAQYILKK